MSYVNREASGTVARTKSSNPNQALVDRIMMIAERLVAAEKEIETLKKKVK
jgi:hypothetical protein